MLQKLLDYMRTEPNYIAHIYLNQIDICRLGWADDHPECHSFDRNKEKFLVRISVDNLGKGNPNEARALEIIKDMIEMDKVRKEQ